jgi:hypothetical protein
VISALIIACATGVYYWWGVLHASPYLGGDFELNWIAARAVMAGQDPFAVVAASGWAWPLYYPMPAQLIAMTFSWLPFVPAECLFVGVSAGVLAFGMTRHAWWGLLVFLTPSFLHAYFHAQWSPLLTGAMLLPVLGGLLAAKPSTGLAYFFSRPSWKGALGAAGLIVASFAVRPGWVGEWLGAISGANAIVAPITRPGGFLLLMALPFWRRADARLLIGLALVPHRTLFYETLPLFTVPRTFRQMAILVIFATLAATWLLAIPSVATDELSAMKQAWPVLLICTYLPALVMALWNARTDTAQNTHLRLELR